MQDHQDAPVSTTGDATARELIVILNPHAGIAEYLGARAQLEAENLLPDGFKWPTGYADIRWKSGQFDYWLRRTRPPGAKGPRRQFVDCDCFSLRWDPICRPSWAEKEIARQKKELADAIYRNSAKGRAEWETTCRRIWKATTDERFQTFMAAIPGVIGPRRGRPRKAAQ